MKYKIGNSTATLIIKLDNGNKPVSAGGRVSGRVCLSIDAAVSNQHRKDHQLTIEVEGKEKAVVRDGPKSSKASRSLLSLTPKPATSLADADGSLHSMQPGRHEFPFEFDLPRGLPSTMRCDSGNSCCEIKYKIKARVENKKKRQGDVVHRVRGLGLSQGMLEAKRELLVLAAPHPPETVPWNMEPVTSEIKTFGVVRQGFVSFGVRLLDTHVSKGDSIQVYFACRNTSTEMEIEWMEMTLWEMVEWTVPKRFGFGAGRKSRRVLANQRFTLSAPSMEFMDSMGSNISVGSSMARTVREETHIRNRQNIYSDLQREKNRFSIRVPLETTDTYGGKLVTCTHSLEVKVKTSNMMQDPRVEIPLRLLTYLPNFGATRHSVVVSTRFSLASQTSQVSEDSTKQEEQGQSERSVERNTRQQEPSAAEAADTTTQTEVNQEQVAGEEEEEQQQEEETNQQDDDNDEESNNNRDDSSTRIERFHAITSIRSIVMYQNNNNSSLSSAAGGGDDVPAGLDDEETVSAESYASSLWSGDTTAAEEDSDTELPDVDHVPSSSSVPSIQDLLMEMLMSTQDYEIISTKLEIPEWRNVLAKLQPDELGSIVAHVNLDFDQPKVAALLANHMVGSEASSFTCRYCREALLNTAQWNRITMVQRLLPFCSDLRTHRNVLTEKLTAWELTVVADDFGRLLHHHNHNHNDNNTGHDNNDDDAVAVARREALNDPPKESWE